MSEAVQGSLQHAFAAAAQSLRAAGIETPELDARLLLCHAAGLSHEACVARSREALTPEAATRLEASIGRRADREPVSRITGTREFYGRSFTVAASALDPRPDTETLIEAALDLVKADGGRDRPLNLLDLGTGTGCILLTLLAELPSARGFGTDIAVDALSLAEANAHRLGVADRATFIASDWLPCARRRIRPDCLQPALHRVCRDRRPPAETWRPTIRILRSTAATTGSMPTGASPRQQPGNSARAARFFSRSGRRRPHAVAALLEQGGMRVERREIRLDLGGRPRVVVASR